MDGYIQTAIGVFVSVVFFLIGYRQTIGARRERTTSANRAIYKALLRRLVLEDYSPKLEDVNRLIEGKAQEFKIASGDLHSDEQILNQVFAEIFDNDFIAPEKRIEIEGRLSGTLDQLTKGKQKVDELRLVDPDQERRRSLLLGMLALLASLMGALVSLFLLGDKLPQFGTGSISVKSLLPVIAAFAASLISVLSISFVKRARDSTDELRSRSTTAMEAALLEHQVAAILTKLQKPFQIQPKIGLLRPSFAISLGGKRIAIDVKSWRSPPPMTILSRTARYMQEILRSEEVDLAVVVTRTRLPPLERLTSTENVHFVALRDLEDWLKGQARGV